MDRRTFLAIVGGTTAGLAGCLDRSDGGTADTGGGTEDDGIERGDDAADDFDVGMTATAFVPEEYHAQVGETVVWQNNSSRAHTVTAYEGGIPEEAEYFATGGFESEQAARDAWENWQADPDRSGLMTSGDVYRYTFEIPGRYDYVCIPHEVGGMIGRVVVEE